MSESGLVCCWVVDSWQASGQVTTGRFSVSLSLSISLWRVVLRAFQVSALTFELGYGARADPESGYRNCLIIGALLMGWDSRKVDRDQDLRGDGRGSSSSVITWRRMESDSELSSFPVCPLRGFLLIGLLRRG